MLTFNGQLENRWIIRATVTARAGMTSYPCGHFLYNYVFSAESKRNGKSEDVRIDILDEKESEETPSGVFRSFLLDSGIGRAVALYLRCHLMLFPRFRPCVWHPRYSWSCIECLLLCCYLVCRVTHTTSAFRQYPFHRTI